MDVPEAVTKAKQHLKSITNFTFDSVVGVHETEQGWKVVLELLERKGIPDTIDILGRYEIKLDDRGNMLSYERKGLRKRGDMEAKE